jgi:hypothetical protein
MEIVDAFYRFKELGVHELVASAERGSSYTGYWTWGLLGFTGDIPVHVLPEAQAKFGAHVTRVEQLMSSREGRAFWKAQGDTWEAHFDFRDGSHSWTIFSRFSRRRHTQS